MAVQFLSICSGANQGSILSATKNNVDKALAQKDLKFQGVNGFFYAQKTIAHVNQALRATGRVPSSSFKYVVWLTPPLLALVKGQQSLNTPVEFVQKHLLIIAQVANAVSSVALIAFGNPFFGTASLLFLTLGVLDQNQLLPKGVMRGVDRYIQPILLPVGLVTGDVLTRFISLVLLVEWAAEQSSPLQTIAPQSQLNVAKYTALQQQPVKINRAHIYYFAQKQSLQKKVLDHLRDKRTEWLQSKVAELALCDIQKESMEASCADRLGATYKGAAQPELVSKIILSRMLEKDFWEEHVSPGYMIDVVKMAIFEGKIQEEEIIQFWEEWIQKHPELSAQEKASLKKDFSSLSMPKSTVTPSWKMWIEQQVVCIVNRKGFKEGQEEQLKNLQTQLTKSFTKKLDEKPTGWFREPQHGVYSSHLIKAMLYDFGILVEAEPDLSPQ